MHDGREIVLKWQHLDPRAPHEEILLRAWSRWAPQLISRPAPDVLVLERLDGDNAWGQGRGVPAARAAGALLARMHSAGQDTNIEVPLRWWLDQQLPRGVHHRGWERYLAAYVELCERLDEYPAIVLHGDFWPSNLLVTEGGLKVIDPMGFRGPAAWDLALYASMSGDPLGALAELVEGYGQIPPGLGPVFEFCLLRAWSFARIPKAQIRPLFSRLDALVNRLLEGERGQELANEALSAATAL